MRLEYGIDSAGNDGVPDSYLTTPPTTLAELGNIVAVKVHVLARSLEKSPGYTDSKTYQLGGISYTVPTADAGYKRHVFSTTIRLVNPSGRREIP
jgi:type IV pilus assembly protein PilW